MKRPCPEEEKEGWLALPLPLALPSRVLKYVVAPFLTKSDVGALRGASKYLLRTLRAVWIGMHTWGRYSRSHLIYEELRHVKSYRVMKNQEVKRLKLDLPSLTRLEFAYEFNHQVTTSILPAGLKELVFRGECGVTFHGRFERFTMPIHVDVLPSGLSKLFLSASSFNQPLQAGLLPAGLTHLELGEAFRQPITAGVLPEGLTYLAFGACCNQDKDMWLPDVLPAGLTHLRFGYEFDQPVPVLPSSLTHLFFGFRFNQPLNEGRRSRLPPGLTHLDMGNLFDQSIKHKNRSMLPESVTHLFLGNFNKSLPKLPASLTHLEVGGAFNRSFKHRFPAGLTHLRFGNDFDKPLTTWSWDRDRAVLPKGLTHLSFGFNFDRTLLNLLPAGLTHLKLGGDYGRDRGGALPVLPCLTHLEVDDFFTEALPVGLTYFHITRRTSKERPALDDHHFGWTAQCFDEYGRPAWPAR